MNDYQIIKRGNGFWQIRDKFVHAYLLSDGANSLLIDTGFGEGELQKLTIDLAGKEPDVILTHSHGDHIGGVKQFNRIFAGVADMAEIDSDLSLQNNGKLREANYYIWNHDAVEGVSIVALPGHTPGSIGVLDNYNGRFFIGDYLSYTPVYMCLPGADMHFFRESLLKIQSLSAEYDELYVGHESEPMPKELLDEFIILAEKYLEGKAKSEDALYFDQFPCKRYFYKKASVLI